MMKLMTKTSSRIMKYILEITQITPKITSAQEAHLCELKIVQTSILIRGQPLVLHIMTSGTLGRKFGATSKEGTCTLYQT